MKKRRKERKIGERRDPRLRRAFSMIELVVTLLVGAMALVGIWALFFSGTQHQKATDKRLKGVQGAHILVQHLEHDLKRIYFEYPRFPIKITAPPKSSLEFFIYDEEASQPERLRIRCRKVRYEWNNATYKVTRIETGRGRKTFQDLYERVVFGYPPHKGQIECLPLEYAKLPPYTNDLPAIPVNPNVLTYQITCTPMGILKRPYKDRKPSDRTTVLGGVLVPNKASSQKYHHWMPNLSSLPER